MTRIVALPAGLTAIVWGITLRWVGNVDRAPAGVIVASFLTLYATTAVAIVVITAFASARKAGPTGADGWTILRRRGWRAALTLALLCVLGGLTAALLNSFLLAWFVGSFVALYAVPMVVTGEHGGLRSIAMSAKAAVLNPIATFFAAVLIDVVSVAALIVGGLVAPLPLAGPFLESLTLQLAFGFAALVALRRSCMLASVKPQALPVRSGRRSSSVVR